MAGRVPDANVLVARIDASDSLHARARALTSRRGARTALAARKKSGEREGKRVSKISPSRSAAKLIGIYSVTTRAFLTGIEPQSRTHLVDADGAAGVESRESQARRAYGAELETAVSHGESAVVASFGKGEPDEISPDRIGRGLALPVPLATPAWRIHDRPERTSRYPRAPHHAHLTLPAGLLVG